MEERAGNLGWCWQGTRSTPPQVWTEPQAICHCHPAQQWPCEHAQLAIPACIRECPYCSFVSRAAVGVGGIVRKHIRRVHLNAGNPNYPGLEILQGHNAKYVHKTRTTFQGELDTDAGSEGEAVPPRASRGDSRSRSTLERPVRDARNRVSKPARRKTPMPRARSRPIESSDHSREGTEEPDASRISQPQASKETGTRPRSTGEADTMIDQEEPDGLDNTAEADPGVDTQRSRCESIPSEMGDSLNLSQQSQISVEVPQVGRATKRGQTDGEGSQDASDGARLVEKGQTAKEVSSMTLRRRAQ